ncbi:hypothetical protein Mapa_016722 [Marchantia paleacea]|nr:hypothetical protein Mapa_016722 [Marchantia paleacea]
MKSVENWISRGGLRRNHQSSDPHMQTYMRPLLEISSCYCRVQNSVVPYPVMLTNEAASIRTGDYRYMHDSSVPQYLLLQSVIGKHCRVPT